MNDNQELIIPIWFESWFNKIFKKETTTPSYIIRALGFDEPKNQKDIVYRALQTGELEAFKPGGRWKIPKPAIKIWLLSSHTLNR